MPKARPVEIVPEDPAEGLSPLEYAQLQQLATSDRTHPLHPIFVVEAAKGHLERLDRMLVECPPEDYDLDQVKLGALSVAGHMQKISLWASLMALEPDRLKVVR